MIYLDNNATTHLDPDVSQLLQKLLIEKFGNPSSIHHFGRLAKNLLYPACDYVAEYFGVKKSEIVFTSGATEGLNMAILGLNDCPHIITSALEHLAVLEPILRMEKKGAKVTRLRPTLRRGSISKEQVEAAITEKTRLIVLSAANNETGVITDIAGIAELAESRDILFLVDGVALLGKAPLNIPQGVSAICFSSHKIHGPHGVGLNILRKRHKVDPMIVGGSQQEGRRGGTENLFAIAGFVKAIEMLKPKDIEHMLQLRIRFERGLKEICPDAMIHGENEERVSNTTNVYFPKLDGEELLMKLDMEGVSASLGSACSAGALEPSRVLLNMGLSPRIAGGSLRFSLSRFTTEEEIERTLKILRKIKDESA